MPEVIKDSPELSAIARRWLTAISEADLDAISNLYLDGDVSRYIGTDPTEWWKGRELQAALPSQVTQIREEIRMLFEVDEMEAYEYGTAGWVCISARVTFVERDIKSVPIRFTLVFVLHNGVWRIVQSHNSLTVTNLNITGVEVTKGLEMLLAEMGDQAESGIRDSISEGMVTLMFTDIEDSTGWVSRLGDAKWAKLVAWHDAEVRKVVEANGGSIVKTLGDGAMAAFDSTRSAAQAAIKIQGSLSEEGNQPDLKIRIGLHVGEVLQTGEDYLGQAVNKAARIASAAAGGEIMVSSAVAALLSDDPQFEFGMPINSELKGLPGTHSTVPMKF